MKQVLWLTGLLLIAAGAWGQGRELGDDLMALVENAAEELAEEGREAAVEGILEHFGRLLDSPLDINRASREELEGMHILSDFQIGSLLEYRRERGRILSATEMQLINGFHPKIVGLLLPFIHFGQPGTVTYSGTAKGTRSTLLAKWWWKEGEEEHIGPPFFAQIKYASESGKYIRAGFTLEKDAGEKVLGKGVFPPGDFSSFHIGAKGIPVSGKTTLKSAVLGDFTVRLGQGLALWNSPTLNGTPSAQGAYRRGDAIAPYTSSDENRFFRGGAAVLDRRLGRFRNLETTLFFSRKNVDARIREGKYTSLPTDGLHNTGSLLETRKTLGEMAYGGSIALKMEKARIGINYVGYGYNARNGRKVQEYNRYQMYDRQYGNLSVDAAALWGRVRLFGEIAMDYGGSTAAVCGLISRIAGWETALTLRSYPKSYIAPYASAYSTTSSCSNQRGATIALQKQSGKVKLQGYGEYAYYPGARYGTSGPCSSYRIWWLMESVSEKANWSIKLYGRGSAEPAEDGKSETSTRLGIKGSCGIPLSRWAGLRLRGEGTTDCTGNTGTAASIGLDMDVLQQKLRLLLYGTYYSCKEWNCRLYMYEHDLPSSYVSRLLYGRGFIWYAKLQYRAGRKLEIHLKADNTPKIKLGLKMRFF